jgi:hypothetical protein
LNPQSPDFAGSLDILPASSRVVFGFTIVFLSTSIKGKASKAKASIENSTRSSSIPIDLRLRCYTPGQARQRQSPPSHTISTIHCGLNCLLFRNVDLPTMRACILFYRHTRCPRPNALPEFIGLQLFFSPCDPQRYIKNIALRKSHQGHNIMGFKLL